MSTPHVLRCLLALVATVSLASEARAQASTLTDAPRGVVMGVVRGRLETIVIPVAYALVEVVQGGVRPTTTAAADGRYTLADVPPGDVTLSATHLGYESLTLTVTVPARDSITVDLELTAAPMALSPVDVRGRSLGGIVLGRDGAEAPLPELDLQALDVGPGVGQPGLADVVAALPGNEPGDATDILFMRGSTADLKLVLLDGVPVYTPFHVAGLMKSFEQSVLGSAELHVGGAPARFDGGLTNILELRTRAARRDRLRVSGSADLLAASAAVESPLGDRAGLILSARSLHGLGSAALGGAAPYGYHDALLAASAEPAPGHELCATGFLNEESVVLDADQAPASARWANRAGSFGYGSDLGAARLDLTAGLSAYRGSLPLQPSGQTGSTLLAAAATDRMRVVGEVTWGTPEVPVRTGVSFERLAEHYTARFVSGGPSAENTGSVRSLGAFLDVTRPLAPGLTLRAGARADHFTGGATYLAPRASIAWEVGPGALVTVAAGRYHQPTRASEVQVERSLADFADGSSSSSARLPVATADHVVLSLDQRLGNLARIDLQGFWKGYRGLPSAARESVRSSRVDVRIVTVGDGNAAWLGYGLSWFWSTTDLSGRASQFVGRHLLSAGLSGHLVGPLQAEARVAYGARLPYTSIPFGGPGYASTTSGTINQSGGGPLETTSDVALVEGLDETFLRLDLEVHALFEPTWGGRAWRVRPHVRILNALDRRDALFYTYQRWRSDAVRPLAERPVLPLLGVAFSF